MAAIRPPGRDAKKDVCCPSSDAEVRCTERGYQPVHCRGLLLKGINAEALRCIVKCVVIA